jgi:hypothetical protein
VHVAKLEKRIAEMTQWANDPKTDMVKAIGTEKTHEQIVPIMDGLTNNNEGYFQVNVPNHGALEGIGDDVVAEVPAIVNEKGIQPVHVGALPSKIMFERILPRVLEMERDLLAFKTGDKSVLLYDVLDNPQTRSYDQALAVLEETMNMDEVKKVEDWEKDDADQRLFQVSQQVVDTYVARKLALLSVHIRVPVVQLDDLLGWNFLRLSDLKREPNCPRDIFNHHGGFHGGISIFADGEDAMIFKQHCNRFSD